MLIRRLLILCAMGVFLAGGPAWAAGPTTISGSSKTPQDTSTDGDLTIAKSGAVAIDTAGAAVTIDSDNQVTNNGTISNNAATGAIGVLLEGGGADASFTSGGAINLEGKNATGGIGIEVSGPSGFTGNIDLTSTSTVTVTGDNSTGLAIFGPLVGNVTLAGSVLVTGQDAMGILVEAPITGTITNAGTLDARGITTLSTKTANPQSGSALAIGASVSGGVYNAGPDALLTTTAAATIKSQGSAPTIIISPSVAGTNAADLTMGVVIDPDLLNTGYSFLNRGNIISNGTDPGVDATAIQIAGDGTYTATLTGGIFNGGTISANATTGNNTKHTASADSVTIEIGDGGIVPDFVNTGTVAAQTSGLANGTATAILIDAGGSLSSLDNSGKIVATAVEVSTGTVTGLTLTACAICDESGTLTSLTNSGTITAQGGTVVQTTNGTVTNITYDTDDGNTLTDIAVDMSHVAAGTSVSFVNTGNVNGEVLFGASDDTLQVENAGTLIGDVSFGGGSNRLDIVGAPATSTTAAEEALVDGAITYDPTSGGTLDINIGTNGVLKTPLAEATTLEVASGGEVEFVLGSTAPAAGTGIVTATGNAVFAAGSSIAFGFDASLPDSGTYTLIQADGGLTFPIGNSNPADNVSIFGLPYLYNLEHLNLDTNDLTLQFQRKTAGQLDLTGNQASMYGVGDVGSAGYMNSPLMAGARGDAQFGAALMDISSAAGLDSALDQLTPDLSGDTRALAIALTDQATGPVGARQRTLTEYAASKNEINVWGQEFGNLLSNGGSGNGDAGYNGRGFGFAMGADGGAPANGRFGGAFTFFAGQVDEPKPRDTKTNIEWFMLSLYSDWRGRVLFFNTQANAGYGNFDGERTITVSGLRRKADGTWTDYLASGGFSTGLMFGSGPFTFMPEWNVDALFARENAYDETGARGEDLNLASHDQKSLRSFLGVVLRGNIGDEEGSLQPEIRGGWSYDFLNDPESVTAAFADAPGNTFNLTGPTPAASRLVGGASISWVYKAWSLGFNYDVTDSSGAFVHSGTITLTGHI